ncbi:hypothetical protein VC899_10630 [Citrobacter braakii]|uniref:hypothetical protein n=1 Tax=Citrobacter braakii TaxID=57706 RepID=UPI002B246007|nr:hypothetical protein [Citrobacter braakii]MEB0965643.1 hypothetical protein [Citrobacter braakii]
MHISLQELVSTLTELELLLKEQSKSTSPVILTEHFGIAYPAMYPLDFRDSVSFLIQKINTYSIEEISEDEEEEIGTIIDKLKKAKDLLIPQLFNGNGAQAIPSFIFTLNYVTLFLDTLFSFDRLQNSNLLPKSISRKIKSINARVDQVSPEIENLENKIQTIINAHTAAENLPIDLEELKKANKDINEARENISKIKFNMDDLQKESVDVLKSLEIKSLTAEKYLEKCEEAIRASTSKGLAGAFEIKANKLNWSIRFWVAGLACALAAGGYVGYERLQALSIVLDKPDPSAVVVITQLLLSVLSIGAPLWFSWLSTKQINQRFKLAEDYAYKSSVAKAYEGYRKEASGLADDSFKVRLFDSALSRLEEAPLRFVQDQDHSTPWMEMLNSKAFDKFLNSSIENVNFVKDLLNRKTGPSVVPKEGIKKESDL